ncbi:MAG: 3-hydroxyacyl-ACP dehydratase [Agriterribacter sp.]
MLENDFFHTRSFADDGNTIQAGLELNPEHAIFNGHFPGQPVVPGVCMVQMIKELLEKSIGKSLQLQKADHIKFLSFIVPTETPSIEALIKYNIADDVLNVTASLTKQETVCLKMKGNFVIQ